MEQSNSQDKPDSGLTESSDSALLSRFLNDQDYVFLVRKIEKLIAALYLVSNFLSDQEPLKKTFKTKGIALLGSLTDFNGAISPILANQVRVMKSKVIELSSLLEIAHITGLISDMNFEVLHKELGLILGVLDKNQPGDNSSKITGPVFPERFFAVPVNRTTFLTPEMNLTKGQSEMTPSNQGNEFRVFIKNPADKKDKILQKNDDGGQLGIADLGLKSKNKTRRIDSIINLLKKKKDLNIKDFTSVIQGCSEKTIQRELLFLVDRGLIKKIGDRRWSRYSLI